MIRVSEVMTNDVLTISPDAPLEQAAAEMRLGRVRHLPVVDPRGRLVGLLSSFDVMKGLATRRGAQVVDAMSLTVHSVREDAPAAEAAKRMRTKKVGSLPVVDARGALVGLVTETDFLRVAERALSGKPLVP